MEIGFPFNRQEVFLLAVAGLAGGDDIALDRLAAANERNDVVHGQF